MSGHMDDSVTTPVDVTGKVGRILPDVSATGVAPIAHMLDWVGMRNIRMPIRLDDALTADPHLASIDALVNLPASGVKGIHMSRLYRLLCDYGTQPLSPVAVSKLLDQAIASHGECGTDAARIVWNTEIVRQTRALITEGLQGWSTYRVTIEGCRRKETTEIWLEAQIIYSSTCPCSASLARQIIAEQFQDMHRRQQTVAVQEVTRWIEQYGTAATPHSQRSVARIRVNVEPSAAWRVGHLIEQTEAALATAAQGPVKRVDEQEFARRNGQNLMFVEDAVRRLLVRLKSLHSRGSIEVTHLESLHPHDAYAQAAWGAQ